MSPFCIVQTTVDDEALGAAIARALLAQKLAACVQITPIRSQYVWRGEMTEAAEWRLDIKGRASDYPAIAAAIRALHSYEIPEILCLPILTGDAAYLGWLNEVTQR
jgi:periplasmic divalent cation tolerance protein